MDEIKFSDRRLADNSFQGKGETWGMKAQRDLGKVTGDRFRHEKTKKKRGTYQGRGIDFGVRSVPLEDDEDML